MIKIYGVIYKATNIINGKVYIGKTVQDFEKYKKYHINEALRNKNNKYFYNAIRKYSPENFKWEIIDVAFSKEELCDKEEDYIKKYNSCNSKFGYNIYELSVGRHKGFHPSKEAIEKSRQANIGKKQSPESIRKRIQTRIERGNNGCTSEIAKKIIGTRRKNGTLIHSEESKIKNSRSHIGKKATDSTKSKLKEKRKGRKPALGMKHTEQWKINHSNRIKEENHPFATKVFQYSLNGKLLNVFNTIKNCKNYLDISQTIIDNFKRDSNYIYKNYKLIFGSKKYENNKKNS